MIGECGYTLPDTLDMQIDVLVKNTLDRSMRKHGKRFTDNHHAYAVIKEEVEEAGDELNYINAYLESMWGRVREDLEISHEVMVIRRRAIRLIEEALQVAAMCDKYNNSFSHEENERIQNVDCGVNEAPCNECKPVCKDGICYVSYFEVDE